MSYTYFSKLNPHEKLSRLSQLGQSGGKVTVWIKGKKERFSFSVLEFDKERYNIQLNTKSPFIPLKTEVLFSFDLRGMNFFCQATLNKNILDNIVLEVTGELYKSEKRSSYRLMTYPIYEVYAEFDPKESYEGGVVFDFKSKTNQTGLFKNFLKLVDKKESEDQITKLKFRTQDISTTGLSLQVGHLETQIFQKDSIFNDVNLIFKDETIVIPEAKVVYVVDYVGSDRKVKSYKVGMHFPKLSTNIGDQIGKKINELLRQIDSNKDFEKIIK